MKINEPYDYDVLRDVALLEKSLTFENLYSIICSHKEVKASMWLEDSIEKYFTYSQLKSITDSFSVEFENAFGKEGRVCISVDTCKWWFPIFWGLIRSGHDVLLIDSSFKDDKLAHLMDQASCVNLVATRQRNLDSKFNQLLLSSLESVADRKIEYIPTWANDVSLCTSGTISDSQVFTYDEQAICRIALFSKKVYKENPYPVVSKNYRSLAFLPFHHILGFAANFIWCYFLGYTLVYLKDRTPNTITKTCQQCKVNQVIAVPILAKNLRKNIKSQLKKKGFIKKETFDLLLFISLLVQFIAPKTGLKVAKKIFRGVQKMVLGCEIEDIILGGSHTDTKTLKVLNGIGYYTHCGYGMTETSISSIELSQDLICRIKGYIGKELEGLQFKIRDSKRTGELLVKGEAMHTGRFIDGKAVPTETNKDGWFETGDIVRLSRNKKHYFIEGRLKEVIINESGENVYPDELEEFFSSIDGMKSFTVLGLQKNSRYEDISLVINVDTRYNDVPFLTKLSNDIYALNKLIPMYKRVTRAIVTDEEFPLANSFKVKRLELKKQIEHGQIHCKEIDITTKRTINGNPVGPKDHPHNSEIQEKIRSIFVEILDIKEKSLKNEDDIIVDLGGDSLQVLSVATKIEEMFGILIPDEGYMRCTSVNGATELVKDILSGTTKSKVRAEQTPITNFEETPEYKDFKKRRDTLERDGGGVPYFVSHSSPMRDTSIIDGKEIIDFGSYNYVGMSGRKEVSDAAKKCIDLYGTSASGSRLLAGERPVHGELEREIAQWKHSESAVVCVGGHSTNVTVVGNFCGENDLILYDALAHNSIDQGCKLSEATSKSFPHNDIDALERILKVQRKFFEKVLIVIEGAYSMDGDISNVPAFVAIKKKYGCFLMVDEAHSACVLGKTGGGVDEYFNLAPDDIDIKMGTLSKGLGTCGGYIAGKKSLIEYLKFNLPGFVFSVGISPALAGASLEAIRLLRQNPEIMENLHNNIECFAEEAKKRHLDIGNAGKTAILPVLIGKEEDAFALSNELLRRGISVPPAVYPAVPRNKARLRFNVISEHKKEQIIKSLDELVQAASDLNISLPLTK